MARRIVLAITGASGATYGRRLLQCLAGAGAEIHLIISPHGQQVLAEELDVASASAESLVGRDLAGRIAVHAHADVGALPASGSYLTDGMVVCPCSSNTLAEIAAGISSNLIARAAAVHLKEARPLVLVTREMPLSQIDLRNMLRVSRARGIVCPASPGFYVRPRSIESLVDSVVGKVCDLLGVSHTLNTRWNPREADRPNLHHEH
jgi:4-hydroxy-3-polyprenylbenzoate decarboxylase